MLISTDEGGDNEDGDETTQGESVEKLNFKKLQRFNLTKRTHTGDRLQCNEGYIYVFTKKMWLDAYICKTVGDDAKKVSDYPNVTLTNEHYASFHAQAGFMNRIFTCSSWAQHTFSIRFWLDENNNIHYDKPKWNPYFRHDRDREHPSALQPKDPGVVTDLP